METEGKSRQKRVFINKVDSYSSKYISKFLSELVIRENVDSSAEEEGEKKKREKDHMQIEHDATFHVVGTVGARSEGTTWVKEQYFQLSREQLLLNLIKCDVIIYNITQHCQEVDEASWALRALHHSMADFAKPKMYILVSTVMTWAKSKPDRHDDEDLPFTDANYRTRKAHPNFRKHIELEKKVVKLGKTNKRLFSTCVVASGLQYGMGEQIFHTFFKMSWLGAKEIPVFGEGKNIIPTIHINALASVIHNLIDYQPPQTYYLLAMDSANNTMEEIVKAVASVLGPGNITQKPLEDIYLHPDLTTMEIDSLLVNLHMEAVNVREQFTGVQWVCESGLVGNVESVVEEYRQTRGVLPICLCVVGPPAVGKTSVSKQICEYYRLHHVTVTDTISETLAHLEDVVENADSDDDDDAALEEKKLLKDLKEDMEQNEGSLSDYFLVRVMRDKLISHACKNQGWVLDGFPMTHQQAKEIFSAQDESEDEAYFIRRRTLMPELVLALEATDAFLEDRVMNLSETVAQEHNYDEEIFLQRLAKYRRNNMEDETVVNHFVELAVPTLSMTISCDTDQCLLMKKVFEKVGGPRNYGLTVQEVEAEKAKQTEERMRRESQQRADEDQKEAEETCQRASNWEKWTTALKHVKQQEDKLLEDQSIPLKNYLISHVMPTLTGGLIECCSIHPQDPVDFLAEYLVKNNTVKD